MSSPVQLSDLPVASVANDSDVVLLRSGLTDYQCAISLIREINISNLSQLQGGTPLQSDLILIGRKVGSNYGNFQTTFGSVGFPVGTRMWFYNSLPPAPNWELVPNTGNSLCACADQSMAPYGQYNAQNGGVNTGSWQQSDAFLTINQIPSHTHGLILFSSGSSGQLTSRISSTLNSGSMNVNTGATGGGSGGGSNGHNHGNSWRPMANVGVIGMKVF